MAKQRMKVKESVRDASSAAEAEEVVDRKLEDRDYRDSRIPDKETGLLSISIVPGDKHLGHLIIGPQFEARYDGGNPERFEDCQTAQDEYLLESIDCLQEFLDEISGDQIEWDVALATHPCPGADHPNIELIKSLVHRETELSRAVEQVRQMRREVSAQQKTTPGQPIVVKPKIEVKRQS